MKLKPIVQLMRTIYWVWSTLRMSNFSTFTDLECAVSPGTVKKRDGYSKRKWKSTPCLFGKYARGNSPASDRTVLKTEVAVEGSKKFYYHPFWTILNNQFNDISELHKLLRTLRPGIANLLFSKVDEVFYVRKNIDEDRALKLFLRLQAETDLDALSAAVAALIEFSLIGRMNAQYTALILTLELVANLAAHSYLNKISRSLLFYILMEINHVDVSLSKNIRRIESIYIPKIKLNKIWLNYLKNFNLYDFICPTQGVFLYTAHACIQIDDDAPIFLNRRSFLNSSQGKEFKNVIRVWNHETKNNNNFYYSPYAPPDFFND